METVLNEVRVDLYAMAIDELDPEDRATSDGERRWSLASTCAFDRTNGTGGDEALAAFGRERFATGLGLPSRDGLGPDVDGIAASIGVSAKLFERGAMRARLERQQEVLGLEIAGCGRTLSLDAQISCLAPTGTIGLVMDAPGDAFSAPSDEPSGWSSIKPLARNQRETIAIGRLAHACAKLDLAPSFDETQRDQLVASSTAKDAKCMVNAGLKALAAVVKRNGLEIDICPRSLSEGQVRRLEKKHRHGQRFADELADYVAAETATTDAHGRARRVRADLERRDGNAAYRCADICVLKGLKIKRLRDLIQPQAQKAVETFHSDNKLSEGAKKTLFKTLMHVAEHLGNIKAVVEIRGAMAKMDTSNVLDAKALLDLAPFYDLSHRDAKIAALSKVAARIVDGWPPVRELFDIQASIACLLMYALCAVPIFVDTIDFDAANTCDGLFGPRPRLIARAAPLEDIEAQLPEEVRHYLDVYWAQMPTKLRNESKLFVTPDGDKKQTGAFRSRNQRLLKKLDVGLTCVGLRNLAALDRAWEGKSDAEIARALRMDEVNFKRWYRPLLDSVRACLAKKKTRPRSTGDSSTEPGS